MDATGRRTQVAAADEGTKPAPTFALDRAENEGWPQPPVPPPGPPGYAGRIAAFLRSGFTRLLADDALTLEQVHHKLLATTARDAMARARLDALLLVIAADVGDAQRFPALGVPASGARPLQAWHARYDGLDHFLER